MAPLDRAEFRRWRAKADETVAAARLMAGDGRAAWACFLAEQAAQFGVKGMLHGVGVEAWGHDLVRLLGRLDEVMGTPLPASANAAGRRLARHYIPSRYPDAYPDDGPDEHYGAEDAGQALDDVVEILAVVDESWTSVSGGSIP